MKISLKIIGFFLTSVFAFAESKPHPSDSSSEKDKKNVVEAAPKAFDINHLHQHWNHAIEDERNTDGKLIYRPNSVPVGLARFRMAYKFSENGKCEWMFLDPSDAHHFKPGTWEIDVKDKTLLKITMDGTTHSFRIIELTKDVLLLSPL
jgi:hypothetical protein